MATFLLLVFISVPALAQDRAVETASSTPATVAALPPDQIRALIRQVADKDIENDKKQNDYTYIQREEAHKLEGKGKVKSSESKTLEIMVLYGEQVQRLIAKDDKPLSEKDTAREEERIRKLTDKRKNETEDQRRKRAEQEAKNREDARKFVGEVADAYNFRLVGMENLDGRETYVIDAQPRPDFQPDLKQAQILPKFRFRAWIDQAESQWVKLDAECIDTVSVGWFLARIHKGSRLLIDQTRVNDEVWLPRHVAVRVDVRVALLKNFSLEADVTYRDYKKFRTDTRIVPVGELQEQH
ncbi:MAG: hypothetical protein LAO18_17595 [Acidobacteriia bacterium]|nr:hypothetical protein [Terriglobia bacterium]